MVVVIPHIVWDSSVVESCLAPPAAAVGCVARAIGCVVEPSGRLSQLEPPTAEVLIELFVDVSTAVQRLQLSIPQATFVFASVQMLLEAGDKAGWANETAVEVAELWSKQLTDHTVPPGQSEDGGSAEHQHAKAHHLLPRPLSAAIDEWIRNSLLGHWEMYGRAFSKQQPTRQVKAALRVEAPLPPQPLSAAAHDASAATGSHREEHDSAADADLQHLNSLAHGSHTR